MRPDTRETLTTSDVPPRARLERWNDFGSETLANMVVDPTERDTFRASLSRLVVGSLGFTWMTTSPAVSRGHGGVGAWAAPAKDAFVLMVQEAGETRIEQFGREIVLTPGDMTLFDVGRPHRTWAARPMSLVMIKLPTERLMTRIPAPETLLGVALRASRGETALAANMLLGMKRAFSLHPGEHWDDAASDVILDVLALACGGNAEASAERRTGEGGRRDAMAYIERHLTDPGLSVADIAAGIGVSLRQLQRLFLEAGATPSQYLLERRLDAAASLLRRGEEGGVSITEVALGIGFNDLSYFSRTFTRRHGLSPRAYRRRWARG